MQSYDPNNSFGKHTVEITFQKWEFSKTVLVDVWGNIKGIKVLDYAIEVYADQLYDEQGDNPTIILKDDEGNILVWTLGENGDYVYRELERACVSLKIVDFVPEVNDE